ncbi:bifunctional 3-(3-hydroxy-phenyl)propionate/3-hydroxycinnamic acid hydroxylase [Allorhizobium undicola]|uniref:bifunctional 3-(3-hydroxy-phenyl)propionate/3-hydroxycinnamic acid hydroxylase n=1 Tax=Allorhizobium undicola TaxID=78527 RepID=UPI000480EB1D|nr:bifunctional 3-(3-hydroxy-phenyl)propionate/3-hydroxycinnamic acid hydroxylase [Allorhizobium undicola]
MTVRSSLPFHDVLIVGFGPAGAVASAMLAARGHSVLVIDRLTDVYDKPRAIALDHEILRHFDNMGIADKVLPFIEPFTASQHFGADGQLIRRVDMVSPPYPLGYTPSMVFTQPPVEAALRDHAAGFDNLTIRLGVSLADLQQQDDHVLASLKDADGAAFQVKAKYVIGCDGASSTVRELVGIKLEDLVFDEPWLVVDVRVHPQYLEKLPQTSAQFCNPARPTSYVIGPNNHRRWEIMLLEGENPQDMQKPDNVWKLLAPWLTPEEGELWRAASYRFHALVADDWRKGRVVIAGDAAHQQPPFIGQGMCQGLRDVSNLVWRLDRILKGQSGEHLLDSYTVERKRHVETLTGKIKAIGQAICERDPQAAAARDRKLLADGGGKPLVVTRQDIVPPLETGLIANEGVAARGLLFPQPVILQDGKEVLLDKLTGPVWRLVLDGRVLNADAVKQALALPQDIAVLAISPAADAQSVAALPERDGVMAQWFDKTGASAALVRPDHYVFGAAKSQAAIGDLVREAFAVL